MLYLIGLGLGNEQDITLRGLDAVKRCDVVYLEGYTSLLQCSVEELETLYGKKVIVSARGDVENKMDEIIDSAKEKDVALLIVGDPMSATTHISFLIEARKKGVEVKVVHNASILTAVGVVGLELYKYGKMTSIPFHAVAQGVTAPYDALFGNLECELHTLVLLDLDPVSNKFMTIPEALDVLLGIEEKVGKGIINLDTVVVGVARLGSDNPVVRVGTVKEVKEMDFGKSPFALIIPSKLHFVEEEVLEMWKC
jgi:diphthine synthase